MEMIRGRDGYRGEEVRGEIEHGGARATRGGDQLGQTICATDHEGAHPAEGGHLGRRRRLSRRRWTPASTPSVARDDNWSRKDSRRRWCANTIRTPPVR